MNKRSRRAISAVVSGLVLTASASVTLTAEAAAAPSEVTVIPADVSSARLAQRLTFAGTTGFLHQRTTTSPWLWTTYAGVTEVVDEMAGVNYAAVLPAGGDTVEFLAAVPGHDFSATTRPALDLGTMTWRQHTLPGSGYSTRLLGDFRVVLRNTTPPVREVWSLAADGSHETTPITGIPDDTTSASVRGGDATAAVLALTGAGNRLGFLEFASGRVTMLTDATVASAVLFSADRVGVLNGATVRTWKRSALSGPPTTVSLPASPTTTSVGLAGDDLIVAPSVAMAGRAPVLRYPAGGGTAETVVAAGDYWTAQARDGVLIIGGEGSGDWSIRKATASGQSVVTPLTPAPRNAGLTLLSGRLRHLQSYAAPGETDKPEYRLFTHSITGPAEATPDGGPLPSNVLPCQTGAACVRTVDGYGSRTVHLLGNGSSVTVRAIPQGTVTLDTLPSAGATIADVSSSWVLVNGTSPARLYLLPVGNEPALTRTATGAALVGDILWSAAKAGYLQAEDLVRGTVGISVPTGSACKATEVQATARQLYWSCGASGPAGVYDKVRKKNIALPPAQYLLGDNYVARHDTSGALVRHDLTDGVFGPAVTLATFPRGNLADERSVTWAVDKLGGDVAWADESGDVHIVDPGVTPSRPAATAVSSQDALYYDSIGWSGSITLNQPVESSKTTITEVRTGTVVATTAGGFGRYGVYASWNGLVAGKRATSGTYRFSVTGTAGGVTATLGSGTFLVMCVLPRLHSPECTGAPALLGIRRTSTRDEGHWLISQPTKAALWDQGSTEDWTGVTAIVPYGDISRDYMNDLLIRRPDGSLRVYLGIGQSHFGGRKSLVIPGNWNKYNALIHTGDISGDGQSDLIARDRETGALYRFNGNGKGGFAAGVKLAGGYKGYSRFVGPGDINGDGKADLILLLGTTMYALYGAGNGTFQAGLHLVSTGWLGYNVIIGAGDLNEDGRNDLVVRDAAGNLFRRLGTGKGTFGDRQLIGAGYQKYAGLY